VESTPRSGRVNKSVKEALAQILIEDIKDPRLRLVTITGVEVSKDRHFARVWVTAHGDSERYAEVLQGLSSASGRIRTMLGKRVRIRCIPELDFRIDDSVDAGMQITRALAQDTRPVHRTSAPDED